jgi:hypothetical protein
MSEHRSNIVLNQPTQRGCTMQALATVVGPKAVTERTRCNRAQSSCAAHAEVLTPLQHGCEKSARSCRSAQRRWDGSCRRRSCRAS